MRLDVEIDHSFLRSINSKKSYIFIKIASFLSQDTLCNDMRLDTEVNRSIISSIATKEATNMNDLSSLLLSDAPSS